VESAPVEPVLTATQSGLTAMDTDAFPEGLSIAPR
jgi:hypothetical protein